MRYADFGQPVRVPSSKLADHWPGVPGEWVNFYDKDDVIGYPLKKNQSGVWASCNEGLGGECGELLDGVDTDVAYSVLGG